MIEEKLETIWDYDPTDEEKKKILIFFEVESEEELNELIKSNERDRFAFLYLLFEARKDSQNLERIKRIFFEISKAASFLRSRVLITETKINFKNQQIFEFSKKFSELVTIYSRLLILSAISAGSTVDSKRSITSPSRFTRNLVKFHLILELFL